MGPRIDRCLYFVQAAAFYIFANPVAKHLWRHFQMELQAVDVTAGAIRLVAAIVRPGEVLRSKR
jgi:hypothetical protein